MASNTILNTVIDQIVRPEQYVERPNRENSNVMHKAGFWKLPSELLGVLEELRSTKTPDPYLALGLRTGFISEIEVRAGKLPETWSMRKILNNFSIDPEQTLITSMNTSFRDNSFKVGTVSGYLYNKLSNKENKDKMLFGFEDICNQFSYHNYLLEIVQRVAKRYVEDYGIKENSRSNLRTYHLAPMSNKNNRTKVSKRIEDMMKNKEEPKCSRIGSGSADFTMKLIEDKQEKKETREFDFGD